MPSQHNCSIIIPVHLADQEEIDFTQFFDLRELELKVDCSRIGLPVCSVQIEYLAPDQPIFDVVNAYIGAPSITDDDDLFSYLQYSFGISEGYAYRWLKFDSVMHLDDHYWDKRYKEEHDFARLFGAEYGEHRYGFVDGKYFGDGSRINFSAKQYFCEKFYNLICALIIVSNIARPGFWESACAIVSTTDEIDGEHYGLSNAQAHALSGIYSEYVNCPDEKFEWPKFSPMSFLEVWRWATSIPGFIDGSLSEKDVGCALNAFSYNFKPIQQGEKLLYNVMALEAIYSNGERGIRKQLKRNIPKCIDVATILGTDDSDQIIRNFYGQRSDYIHGLKNLPNPFRPRLFPGQGVHEHDSDLWTAKAQALVILIESLRKLALQGDEEITREQENKENHS